MPLDNAQVLSIMRATGEAEALCRAAGIGLPEFTAARDALLRDLATIGDQRIQADIGGTVEILRDRAGVPHIYAATSEDLHFGLGVAMAQDRLWQMDRLRRRTLGRQAEILGPAYLASDIAHLTVGTDQMAAREPALMDGATYTLVSRMVAGINRQIAAFGDRLPIEFQVLNYRPAPFTVDCVVAIARGIWWSLNGRIDRIMAAEAARLLPTEALRTAYLTPEASDNLVLPAGMNQSTPTGTDDATGSNNWAVAAARSGNGQALLAGDPHQPYWVPSSWYEFALHGPEDDMAGAGHPGMPGMWWGSNGRIAWTITNNAASTRDLYREEVDPARPGQYRDGDTWRAFTERSLSIPVRGAAAHDLLVRSTVRGPLVNGIVTSVTEGGEPPLSLRWNGAEHLNDLRACIAIGRAQNWAQFRDALRDWAGTVFNFVYADREGNAGYQMAGRVPVRGRIQPGLRDAANPADRWLRHIAFDDLPRAYNPARHYVASANQRIVPTDFGEPIYGAYSQGHRGIRIDEVFAAMGQADQGAMIALQNDVKSIRAERTAPLLTPHLTGDTKPLADLLAGWDFHYTLDSAAPTAFETFMAIWVRRVLEVHLPARLIDLTQQQTGLATMLLEQPDLPYFPGGTAEAVRAVAREALAKLTDRLGPDPAKWRWRDVHFAHWKHPVSTGASEAEFDIGPLPVDGGSHTVRNTGGEAPPHMASSGAEYRIVVDFAAPDSFLAVQNIGNSGMPGSPHYRDQFEPFLRGEYHEVKLRRAEIAVESTTTIVPG